MLEAKAAEIYYQAESAGQRALNETANILTNEQISMQVKIKLFENLAEIVRESVKPMENIDGIKIISVEGLHGGAKGNYAAASATAGVGTTNNGNLAEQVVSQALRYRAQAPLLDSLMKEIGLDGNAATDLSGILKNVSPVEGKAPHTEQEIQKQEKAVEEELIG